MDNEPQVEVELNFDATMDGDGPPNDQFPGAFFPKAQHFVVAGGKFKSITNINHGAPTVPFDFRTIPIGDLDLCKDIRVDNESGTVNRWQGRHSVRRMYSARIHGFQSPLTVALYQGESAEEEWRQDISQYLWLRHPNFLQLYATANSSGIHAAIFHDELITASGLLEKYGRYHLKRPYVNLWEYFDSDYGAAERHVYSVSGTPLWPVDCKIWIRASTGRCCIELTCSDNASFFLYNLFSDSRSSTIRSLLEYPENWKVLDSLSLDRHHEICSLYFSRFHHLSIPAKASVCLGAIISDCSGSMIEQWGAPIPWNDIARVPYYQVKDSGWKVSEAPVWVMESGWTRVDSGKTENGHIYRKIGFQHFPAKEGEWLAQAAHVFDCLGITSNHNHYVFVEAIIFMLRLSDIGKSIPSGYLFLCPSADLQSNQSPSRFRRPECPAYWSLNSSGTQRLSIAEAEELGFPRIDLTMNVHGHSWDESVYLGIRQFHQAKGYDPYSQNVARELGYPIFELSTDVDGPFEHVQESQHCCGASVLVSLSHESGQELVHKEYGAQDKFCPTGLTATLSAPDGRHAQPIPSMASTDAEMAEPSSRTLKIIMGAKFILMLALALFWLYEHYLMYMFKLSAL